MTIALIGLIGVIAGALFGGVVNAYVDRRRRWAASDAVGRLISAELTIAALLIDDAVGEGTWWHGSLPSEAWKTHAQTLAEGTSSPPLLKKLAAAYAIIDGWNAKAQAQPVDARASDLRSDHAALLAAQRQLDEAIDDPPGRRYRAAVRVNALTAAMLIASVLLVAASVPRPSLTDARIASAFEQKLPGTFIDCDSDKGDWLCKVRTLAENETTCPASLVEPARGSTRGVRRVALLAAGACRTGTSTIEVSNEGERLAGVQSASGQKARDAFARIIYADTPEQSGLAKLWDKITGKSR